MSIISKLTEGVTRRDVRKEDKVLKNKWEQTGLLEGLNSETASTMSRLLENQAMELLREASVMSAGDVEGFAAVAFPIVRRVFGGLIANDLVSVQPMSLPSGLIFFLDFTFQGSRLGANADESLYGGAVVASQITGGVDLSDGAGMEKSFYNMNNGYASPTGSATTVNMLGVISGTFGQGGLLDRYLRYDPDLVSGTTTAAIGVVAVSDLSQMDRNNLVGIHYSASAGQLLRRLTVPCDVNGTASAGETYTHVRMALVAVAGDRTPVNLSSSNISVDLTYPQNDNFNAGSGLGSVVGATTWGLEDNEGIPEIDIKVNSVSVEADTKKLKAKWTPELGQDLNAYHNIDAEVELTSILSEQIALELDREIIEDLIKGATAATLHWSRRPGKFLNRETGANAIDVANEEILGADFTGNVSEWYETLLETINDVSAKIHRKTLRGGANFVVCGPEVANILEFTSGFRANVTHDDTSGEGGAVKLGSLSKKWDVFVDPYFPRNLILAGRKGSSFLESGYVFAPYVPLQVTPTIFGTEDFVPRKGVMTRYGKKMVRPDMYGLVIVHDLVG